MIQISDKDETILRKTPELVGEDKHAAWPAKELSISSIQIYCYPIVIPLLFKVVD